MAKEEFYRYSNGKRIKLTNKEVKAYIMKTNGRTSEQYNKQYDILRNKVRSYEAFERASGKKNVQSQSVQGLLFKEAKAKKRLGSEYKPSLKMQRIKAFTSVSSGKALQKSLQSRKYVQRRQAQYEDTTYKQFKGLIENNATAKKIYETIKDPVMREKALTDFANAMHTKINESEEEVEDEAIPFGETYGSGEPMDFDISAYL